MLLRRGSGLGWRYWALLGEDTGSDRSKGREPGFYNENHEARDRAGAVVAAVALVVRACTRARVEIFAAFRAAGERSLRAAEDDG